MQESFTIPTEINWCQGLGAALTFRPDFMNFGDVALFILLVCNVFLSSLHLNISCKCYLFTK